MPSVCDGVDFTRLGREWRCKWSNDNDKASLKAVQALALQYVPAIKALPGFVSVQRIVCGSCNDFKLIFTFEEAAFGDLPGETQFLQACAAVNGVTAVETQTYTISEM